MRYILLILFLFLASPATAGESQATASLRGTIDRIMSVLQDPAFSAPEARDKQRSALRAIINDVFDYQELSRRTVGRYWKKFSPKQKVEFSQAFSDLLDATYMDRLQGYSTEQITITGERRSKKGNVEVQTMVTLNDQEFSMNYRMTNKGAWKIYDVVVEGVSLVKNYRVQFQEVMLNGTPDDLIGLLRKRSSKTSTAKQRSELPTMRSAVPCGYAA